MAIFEVEDEMEHSRPRVRGKCVDCHGKLRQCSRDAAVVKRASSKRPSSSKLPKLAQQTTANSLSPSFDTIHHGVRHGRPAALALA
jgi:hypothetical protein